MRDSALAFAANAARASFLSRALEASESDGRILSVDLESERKSFSLAKEVIAWPYILIRTLTVTCNGWHCMI